MLFLEVDRKVFESAVGHVPFKDLTILMFSRSGYKDLLGTPKRLLLRPSGNIMIISRVISRLNVLGELRRGSKFCDLTFAHLSFVILCCVCCFSLGDETYF